MFSYDKISFKYLKNKDNEGDLLKDKRDLLAIGHTAFDYIIQVTEFPQPNSSTAINRMRTFYGGAAANVAVAASRWGLKHPWYLQLGEIFMDLNINRN